MVSYATKHVHYGVESKNGNKDQPQRTSSCCITLAKSLAPKGAKLPSSLENFGVFLRWFTQTNMIRTSASLDSHSSPDKQ